jgi:hypothetical protein
MYVRPEKSLKGGDMPAGPFPENEMVPSDLYRGRQEDSDMHDHFLLTRTIIDA